MGWLALIWFAVFVYALARTTVWLQEWGQKRAWELEKLERHRMCNELADEIRRARFRDGEWL
jgi:hypothetical protein